MPRLITAEMVQSMKPGSVIVDMAAEQGGNCERPSRAKAVVKHSVTIVGYTDLASRLASSRRRSTPRTCSVSPRNCARRRTAASTSTWKTRAIRGLTVIKEGA